MQVLHGVLYTTKPLYLFGDGYILLMLCQVTKLVVNYWQGNNQLPARPNLNVSMKRNETRVVYLKYQDSISLWIRRF
jgi:hypothetical protein